MQRKAIWTAVAVVLLAVLAVGQAQQTQEEYLDVFTVQVKPEKRADFDAINKKIAAANRQNKGDAWLAMETVYGPGDRVTFVSTRHSYGDIEKAQGAFFEALQKTYGKAATDFYVPSLQNSLAGFDAIPTTQQLWGDEGYQKFLKTNAEAVSNSETMINRFLADASNPPEEIAGVAPDFWTPKPAAAMNAKATTGKKSLVNATSKSKMDQKADDKEKPQQ